MQKQIYILAHDVARKRAAQACMQAPDGYVVTIQEPKRSIEENSLLKQRVRENYQDAERCYLSIAEEIMGLKL